MQIRRARAGDLPEILRMLFDDRATPSDEVEAGAGCYADAFEEMQRTEGNGTYVAEVDGRIVGTFMLTFIRHLMRQGALVAQIEAVRVDGSQRGRGHGEAMMRWAIDEARRRGCSRMQLTSNKSHKDAHRFYERLGFRATHEGMKLGFPLDRP
jgi:GNAT superfamily N-acetyltransferase